MSHIVCEKCYSFCLVDRNFVCVLKGGLPLYLFLDYYASVPAEKIGYQNSRFSI